MSLIQKYRQIKLEDFEEGLHKKTKRFDFLELPNGNVLVCAEDPCGGGHDEHANYYNFCVYETKTGRLLSRDTFKGEVRDMIASKTGKIVFITNNTLEIGGHPSNRDHENISSVVVIYDPTTHEFIPKEKGSFLCQLRELQSGCFICVVKSGYSILYMDQEGNTKDEHYLNKRLNFIRELKSKPNFIYYAYEGDRRKIITLGVWDIEKDLYTTLGRYKRPMRSEFYYLNDETILWLKVNHPNGPKDHVRMKVWNPKTNEMRENESIYLLDNNNLRVQVPFGQEDGFLVFYSEKNDISNPERTHHVYNFEFNTFSRLDTGVNAYVDLVHLDVSKQNILSIDYQGNLLYFDVGNRYIKNKQTNKTMEILVIFNLF